ncbi:hypothetical protein [Collinsella sp. An2]|uniref:hypothetical protein n=1 Tax=Collinsella sp. An2 TaxID=1965585 RepID=UPI000B384AC1|nr:hypothetical protein [Collinsella sp. An2]OUP11014.1 hypothetical protein B5F33_01110 [Collinsella sp. An2]
MAFDPIQEDCHRLVLEAMRRERIYPLDNAIFIEKTMETFQDNPSSLIVTDRDRSFHLVTRATEIIDYRVPLIVDDAAAEEETAKAEHELEEASSLDPANWDAKRMLAALESESNTAYVEYLLAHRDEVRRDYEQAVENASDPYSREYAGDLARRPYLRWLAALSSRALIAGRYKLSLSTAEESLAIAPDDPADVRLTALLALAKLECSRDDLKRFRGQHATSFLPPVQLRRRHHLAEKTPDAWTLLAELAIAYHELDLTGATRVLRTILRSYPRAASALYFQAEFPDGVYARVHVTPGSEDELILAISEATPLLQEGMGSPTNASFATWVATHELVREALEHQTSHTETTSSSRMDGEN